MPTYPFYPQRLPNTGYITYKYVSENALGNTNPRYDFDRHLIRYAEVLLNNIEAKLERNGSVSDEDLNKTINQLRDRVNMIHLTNEFVQNNGLNMRDEIRRERTIELALEGFRWDDLRRWKTAEIELPEAIKGIKLVGTPWTEPVIAEGANRNPYDDPAWLNNTDGNGFIIVEKGTDRHFDVNKNYLVPIPTRQIIINPKIEQNPNW